MGITGVDPQEWLQSLEPMGFLLCYLPKMLALGHPTVLWRFLKKWEAETHGSSWFYIIYI
jgi:hypothetical protein